MYATWIKRCIDLAATGCLLVLFSWLFLVIITLYVITFQFPIFFLQQRIGKDKRAFQIIKFRTLKKAGPSLQARKFPLGNFVRFFSFDELPQLINVLVGNMSLIGPRPLPVNYLPLFSKEQNKRHSLLPGITGWAQVNGRHAISWQEKFQLDNYYVDHLSFSLDMKILIKTITLILSFKKDVSLDEKEFTGNIHE